MFFHLVLGYNDHYIANITFYNMPHKYHSVSKISYIFYMYHIQMFKRTKSLSMTAKFKIY
jgi:hypothetical protein